MVCSSQAGIYILAGRPEDMVVGNDLNPAIPRHCLGKAKRQLKDVAQLATL